MNTKFKIIISSDMEYDDLCAEIYFEDQFVGILTQEEGFEHLSIDIYPPMNSKYWKFNFSEFEIALKAAKEALWEMRKQPDI
jgi:hypothetical protein